MTRRQSIPEQWLIMNEPLRREAWSALRRVPRGAGVFIFEEAGRLPLRELRNVARRRQLTIAAEASGATARVHNARELRMALLQRTPLILLSPIHETESHPDWCPLPRMRAATLARLGHRRLIALGGMNRQRYAKIAQLGFIGWAGISAFRT